jgi:hypothetical protein
MTARRRHWALAIAVAILMAGPLASTGADAVPLPGAPGELRGNVVTRDGKPITSFTVNAIRFDDPGGNFKILIPPEGHFRVVIRAVGYAPNYTQIEGAAGKKLVLPEIALGQGEKVIGEVIEAATGMPVAGASVSLADPAKVERLRFVRPERLVEVAQTGIGGYYLLDKAPRGLLLLVVRHPEFLTEFVPVNTREQPPVVVLHKPGGLTGTVRDASGGLAAGHKVVAIAEAVYDGGEVVTDSFGRWTLKGLHPGAYKVQAQGPDGALTEVVKVEVRDGRTEGVKLGPSAPR